MKNTSVPAAPAAVSSYEQSALDFLAKHGIAFRVVLAKTQKAPQWVDGDNAHGLHYRVTLWRDEKSLQRRRNANGVLTPGRISFDFWNSMCAKEKGETPTAYDVLSCISGDTSCPDDFAEFCGDYGYDEDSRAALATFRRVSTFSRRLRAFFSKVEIEGLCEIQ